MRVDAHHHFWDPARRDYPWMGETLSAIRRPFGPRDLKPLLAEQGIDASVLVQTVSSLDETAEFLRVAEENDFVRGVVGWVDLTGDVATQVRSLRSGVGGGRIVGIRHQVHDEADAGWLLRPEVERGIAVVGEEGLVYDLLVRSRDLPAAFQLASRHRQVQFVIDHAAKPRIARREWDAEWERAVAPFSELANVACKLSGLLTEAEWSAWTPEQVQPYVARVIGWFGRDRCMFGSDWPVCLLAATYPRGFNTMRELVGDDDAILGGTAARVYGLR